jgi:hypothetical protein
MRHTTARAGKGIGLLYIGPGENFSRTKKVASRNSLYQNVGINVALGVWQRAKSSSQASLYVLGRSTKGELATANFVEFLFHALR